MINFRFHLVSLIAVFLALALGIVMGATVIDQAIVDGLNARIDDVRDEANDQRAENSDLRDELNRMRDYLDRSDDFTASGRLTGVPVAVVAFQGLDDDDVKRTVGLLQVAGAAAPGVVWIEEKWLLDDDESRQQLADIVGEAVGDPAAVREAAWAALAERLAAGSAPLGTDLLATLVEAGFISFESVGEDADEVDLAAYPGPDVRALLVDGTDSMDDANELLAPATRAFVASDLPVVVSETFRQEEDGPGRGSRLSPVRDDDELTTVVSTVDDLDLVEGPITVVLALADLARGVVGQYGYGDGADSALPQAAPQ